MADLTETELSSEQLVDGVLLKVFRDEVRLPDDATSVREWIDHPGAAAIVPIFEDGRTLLIRQFRYPPRRTFLEVPAGKLDEPDGDSESFRDVARRELEEETGVRAARFEHAGVAYPCIGYSSERIHVFTAHDLERGTQSLTEGEFVEVVEMAFDEALARAQRGDLKDMKTITALVYAAANANETSFPS
jgi:ADP-ribose pyrophosphatase